MGGQCALLPTQLHGSRHWRSSQCMSERIAKDGVRKVGETRLGGNGRRLADDYSTAMLMHGRSGSANRLC